MKSLNYVVYEHILIKKVTEEIEKMLTTVNMNRVFTQSLTLVLLCFIEAARTSLLNNHYSFLLCLKKNLNLQNMINSIFLTILLVRMSSLYYICVSLISLNSIKIYIAS